MLVYLICVGLFSGTFIWSMVAELGAIVREDVLMHAGMGVDSWVVGQLQKGEMVTIDIELSGHAGQWCRVI
jgi:uncharacterized protein YgiM (DUF1202 family)